MIPTLSVDQIRALLDEPSQRRPPAAEGLRGVRVFVDGKPAIVYDSNRLDERRVNSWVDEQVRAARRRHAARQAGLIMYATAAGQAILRDYYRRQR